MECNCSNGYHDKGAETNSDIAEEFSLDSEEEQSTTGFVAASQVVVDDLIRPDIAVRICELCKTRTPLIILQYLKKKKAQLATLAEWRHIDCLNVAARDDIPDDILKKLFFTTPDPPKPATPTPHSRVAALLAAVDMSVVSAFSDQSMSVCDVPGGTISFLFEKRSISCMENLE